MSMTIRQHHYPEIRFMPLDVVMNARRGGSTGYTPTRNTISRDRQTLAFRPRLHFSLEDWRFGPLSWESVALFDTRREAKNYAGEILHQIRQAARN